MISGNSKIGVFDSGLGGLSVLKSVRRALPDYDYLYLADSAYAPYGNRSHKDILARTEKVILFLREHNCSLIILACNSASSEALRTLQSKYNDDTFRILGILIPTAEAVAEIDDNTHVGILATHATVSSGAYEREVKKSMPSVRVSQQSAPLLAELIESAAPETEMENVLQDYLPPLLHQDISSLILGCTHYELILGLFQKYVPDHVTVIVTGVVIGDKLTRYLTQHPEIENRLSRSASQIFFTTGDTGMFYVRAKVFIDINEAPLDAVL